MSNEFQNDREPLVDNDEARQLHAVARARSHCCQLLRNNRRFLLFLVTLSFILLGHGIAIYFIYYRCNGYNCLPIKIMTLNCWGMPATFGSEYKSERIKAIAEEISKANFDIYFLEELWMEPDYYTIREKVPKGYHMTEFRKLALPTCDGRVAPTACSGLSIISKFPFREVEFNSYTEHGDWRKAVIDGEWFARKGVGRVRIVPVRNVSIDLFVTHTAADPDLRYHNYTNEWYRRAQVKELVSSYILKSTADHVFLAGDFNAGPVFAEDTPYETIRQHMTNTVEEIFYKVSLWLNANYATYGNLKNTFSGRVFDPIIYDYVFYRTNVKNSSVHTNWFELPFFKLKLSSQQILKAQAEDITDERNKIVEHWADVLEKEKGIPVHETVAKHSVSSVQGENTRLKRDVSLEDFKFISFSDHEAVTTTIYLWY